MVPSFAADATRHTPTDAHWNFSARRTDDIQDASAQTYIFFDDSQSHQLRTLLSSPVWSVSATAIPPFDCSPG